MTLLGTPRPDESEETEAESGSDREERSELSISEQVDVSVHRHVGTIAMTVVMGVLPAATGTNTWWSLRASRSSLLSGQVKTGHLWTPQIRPFPASRDGS